MTEALRDIAERLRRLAEDSDDGKFSWSRLMGRVLRTPRAPKIRTEVLTRMVDRIELGYSAGFRPTMGTRAQRAYTESVLRTEAEAIEPVAALFDAVIGELRQNLAGAERTLFVHGRLPDGHLDRLWRLFQIANRAGEWFENSALRPIWRDLIVADARCALAPLTTASSHGDARPIHGIDAVIAAANAEMRSIGRQRRFLEAARQQLLDTSAAVRLNSEAERARRIFLARRISRIDMLEAAGVAPDVELGFQLRESVERGEVGRVGAVLSALEESAVAAGDGDLQQLARQAANMLWRGAENQNDTRAREESARSSQDDLFGPGLRPKIDSAYKSAARSLAQKRAQGASSPEEALTFTPQFLDQWERYLTVRPTDETLAAAVATDGCFQIGSTTSPVRGAREARRVDVVSFPQEEMVLEPIGGVDDLANAVIDDPRSVLLDLAQGKLLARRYLCPRVDRSGVRQMQNEVRVYVLDGSSSMLGPRARMRDALMLAELSTLSARLQDMDRGGNPVLYYRYFNDEVGETYRIAALEDVELAVNNVVATLRYGGTNIQAALLASFEQIRLAAEGDPDLARAQIVLVTDGEAGIDENAIRRAREDVGDIPVGVSIIALGTENPELRKLAARQRARGERVFYQFVDDDELQSIVDGETAGLPIHLPAGVGRERLTDELRSVVADIQRHLRRIDSDEVGHGADLEAALREVGLPKAAGLDGRTRARIAAIENDRVSLAAAFLRVFPLAPPPQADAATDERIWLTSNAHVPDVVSALTTVAEIVETFGAGAVERQADAIELLERLLAEARIPPWEYAGILERPPEAVSAALRAVHAAARFGGEAPRQAVSSVPAPRERPPLSRP